jgi:multidrug efflux pump subunit AcrA (membrane-fusion protein)
LVGGPLLLALVLSGCGPVAAERTGAAEGIGTVSRGSVLRTANGTGALSGVNAAGGVAVLPFDERAAALLAAGQPARLTFDAVPGLVRHGVVEAVAPTAVTISGVTDYYVTIGLVDSDPRLRAGMTVQAAVTTASLRGVLVVPNAAVIVRGNHRYVDVVGPDGRAVRTEFTAGAVGNDTTQVVAGLREGQQVLLAH